MNPSHLTLMRIVGTAAYSRLRIELAGETLHIPAARTMTAERRRASVARLLAQGVPIPVIAARIQCSVRHVHRIAARPNTQPENGLE